MTALNVFPGFLDPVVKAFQHGILFGFDGFRQPHFTAYGKQTAFPALGVLPQFFQSGRAQLTARRVDDAQERVVVVAVHDQAQVGHDVFDFRFGKKRTAAADLVGDLELLHLQFDQS